VYGGGHRAWECVNIDRDLESCKCLSHQPLTYRVFSFVKLTALLLFVCSPVLKKVVAAHSHLHLTLPSARIVQRSPGSQTSRVCMANVSSTAVSRDTSRLLTTIAASASILNTMMQRTYRRGSLDSSTFPSGSNEKSPKIISASPPLPLYNY
jgi:hypothetical protein